MSDSVSNRWEKFARIDAEFYIRTNPDPSESFFESGETTVKRILAESAPWLRRANTALEIGSGVGRLAIPMSREFRTVVGVDVSPTMIAKMAVACAEHSVANVKGILAKDLWDQKFAFDFVYSYWVFQHIESFDEIRQYLERIAASLSDGGIAYLQFDSRPATTIYKLKTIAPDLALPAVWRRGVRRIRRSRQELIESFGQAGLKTLHELNPDSEDNIFLLKKA